MQLQTAADFLRCAARATQEETATLMPCAAAGMPTCSTSPFCR